MKILFLILCLVIVYGVCSTYGHEKSIDLTKDIQNNEDYKLDYANVPLEKFLARHKRDNFLDLINKVLPLFGYGDITSLPLYAAIKNYIQFFITIVLPALHNFLNFVSEFPFLPEGIQSIITRFNMFYDTILRQFS